MLAFQSMKPAWPNDLFTWRRTLLKYSFFPGGGTHALMSAGRSSVHYSTVYFTHGPDCLWIIVTASFDGPMSAILC